MQLLLDILACIGNVAAVAAFGVLTVGLTWAMFQCEKPEVL